MTVEPKGDFGFWRTRNGTYAQVIVISTYGQGITWEGIVFQEDGKQFCKMKWNKDLNSEISKDYDLVNKYISSEQKGWPEWLKKLAASVEIKVP